MDRTLMGCRCIERRKAIGRATVAVVSGKQGAVRTVAQAARFVAGTALSDIMRIARGRERARERP